MKLKVMTVCGLSIDQVIIISVNRSNNVTFERMIRVKTYTQEEFKKMEALKREFEETGEGELFTKNTVKRRLRVGEEKATQLFNDLTNQEE